MINNAMLSYGVNPQDIIKQHIKHGKLAHAYLLAGPPECTNDKEQFVAGMVNLLAVSPANYVVIGGNNEAITIDMMRDLKTIAVLSAGDTPRVVMIYNADNFTTQAANAFLKTLEEPLSHTIFFLLASSRAGILPTLLSRVWTVRFNNVIARSERSERRGNPVEKKIAALPGRGRVARNDNQATTFFQLPLAERYAINEKLAKLDDHGKQFVANLITHLRYETKSGIKNAGEYLPHAVEAYELLYLPGAPYRLILDTLASIAYE